MTNAYETFDAQLNAHAQRLLKTHETLLRDKVRNAAFYKALEKTIKAGDSVLDIGAGTGIWAITAAKLGAKRVVAIDADELLVGVIKILAAEHGVEDRVEAIWGNSFDISLAREFDVVVSETIGYLGYDENIVAVMHDARQRFLKDGGTIIPETVSLHAAAGHLKVRQAALPEGVPFEFNELANLNLNSPRVLKHSSDIKLLTKSVRLIETDLRKASDRPSLEGLNASWEISSASDVNCVILWVESHLARGVNLSTRRTTSWQPTIFAIGEMHKPARKQGRNIQRGDSALAYARACANTLEFTVSLTPENSTWTATFERDGEKNTREYSLSSAVAKMIASARDEPASREIMLRDAASDDREFVYQVYAATRLGEVATFGWPDAQANAFLRSQFDIRERSYAMQFPDAQSSVILCDKKNAGSMIVNRGDSSITLVDIAVLPEFRKRGIASYLLRELQTQAAEGNKSIVLHVEKINATAFSLYCKHAFAVTAETDLYYEMTWMPK